MNTNTPLSTPTGKVSSSCSFNFDILSLAASKAIMLRSKTSVSSTRRPINLSSHESSSPVSTPISTTHKSSTISLICYLNLLFIFKYFMFMFVLINKCTTGSIPIGLLPPPTNNKSNWSSSGELAGTGQTKKKKE